jgi:hypothetical protein
MRGVPAAAGRTPATGVAVGEATEPKSRRTEEICPGLTAVKMICRRSDASAVPPVEKDIVL